MEYGPYFVLAYIVAASAFIISENRSPQSTFAWMFIFFILPLIGLAIYVLFGRERKAFSRQRSLVRQDLAGHFSATLAFMQKQHDRALEDMRKKGARRDELAVLISSNAHSLVTLGNCVSVLQNADQTYPALKAALAAARSSIHLQYYSWASDALGEELKTLLAEKVKQGVEVRLLYDPVGSFTMLRWSYVRKMRAAGIEMMPFSSLWRLHTISYRNHRKIVVVDGRVAFTGGLNIGCEHIDPPPGFDIWRDTHLCIKGPAALSLQKSFVIDWMNATGCQLLSERYFPTEEAELDSSREVSTSGVDDLANDGTAANVPVQICLSGPDSEWRAIQQLYFVMITSARRQVLLTSPFFILDDMIAEALKTAALSGIDVRVMISARGPDQYVPYWAANTFAADVAEAGVKVLLYQKGYLHAKTICVDGELATVGSANWDIRSFSINYELTALLYDEGLAASIRNAFMRDESDCTAVDPREYNTRSRLLRFRDSVARLMSPVL